MGRRRKYPKSGMSDAELIQSYLRDGSQTAFTQLVARHINLVYSAAKRQLRSHHFAEDVTQQVFLVLAQHAASLKPEMPLAAWLYTVTRRLSIDLIKQESRRRAREHVAADLAAMTPNKWTDIEPWLDEAMANLDPRDSTALLLRFFENKSLRDVGSALGISEDAAHKRVTRAVDRLRLALGRCGVTASTAGLATTLSAHAIEAAPSTLTTSIAASALASSAPHIALPLVTATMTTLQKSILAAAVVCLLGTATFQVGKLWAGRNELAELRQHNAQLTSDLRAAHRQHDSLAAQIAPSSVSSTEEARTPIDAATESEMKAWLERLARLKALLRDNPNKTIPEMRLLSDNDFFRAVQNAKLDDTSWDPRSREDTMMGLRGQAKVRFSMGLMDALDRYVRANDNQLPSNVLDLLPYFKDNGYFKADQVEPDMLQRYALVYTGALKDVPKDEQRATMVEIASNDEEHDQRIFVGPGGAHIGRFSELTDDVRHAVNAYVKTTGGAQTTDPLQLLPYFNPPLSPARRDKFILNAPSLLQPH